MGYVSCQEDSDNRDRFDPNIRFHRVPHLFRPARLDPAEDTPFRRFRGETKEAYEERCFEILPDELPCGECQKVSPGSVGDYCARNIEGDIVWAWREDKMWARKAEDVCWDIAEFRLGIVRVYFLECSESEIQHKMIHLCAIEWAIRNKVKPAGRFLEPYGKTRISDYTFFVKSETTTE